MIKLRLVVRYEVNFVWFVLNIFQVIYVKKYIKKSTVKLIFSKVKRICKITFQYPLLTSP